MCSPAFSFGNILPSQRPSGPIASSASGGKLRMLLANPRSFCQLLQGSKRLGIKSPTVRKLQTTPRDCLLPAAAPSGTAQAPCPPLDLPCAPVLPKPACLSECLSGRAASRRRLKRPVCTKGITVEGTPQICNDEPKESQTKLLRLIRMGLQRSEAMRGSGG